MDTPFPLGSDEVGGDLPDDLRGRIKSELIPGERLLWAARARPRRPRFSFAYLVWYLIATIILGLGGFSLAAFWGAFGYRDEDDAALKLGFAAGVVGFFVTVVTTCVWASRRAQWARTANTLHALTDRRAIIWTPVMNSDGIEVHTIERGRVEKIHRVEYPDGSGDVILTYPGDSVAYNPDFVPERVGFKDIPEVRRVEDLLRKTLFAPDSGKP